MTDSSEVIAVDGQNGFGEGEDDTWVDLEKKERADTKRMLVSI